MPDTQQDFVQQFRALPRERQTALIGKMSSEQKQKLSTALKANPAKTEAKTTGPAPIAGVYSDIGKGFAKGALELGTALSPLINKIPGVGETLAPKQGIQAAGKVAEATNPAQMVGKGLEAGAEFLGGEGALKALTTALKVKDVMTVAKLVKQYPWLSKVAVAGMKSFVLGTAQSAAHGEEHPLQQGALTALTGVAGEAAAGALEKRAAKAIPKTFDAVNEHIGLTKSDLPKWERTNVKDAREVGKAVLEQGALKGTLEETHIAIENARETVNAQTEHLVQNAKGKLVPMHADLEAINTRLANKILNAGQDVNDQIGALNRNYMEFRGITKPNMTVQDTMKLRRIIGKELFQGKPSGVRKEFLEETYHDLNRSIQRALGPGDAERFGKLNRTQNRLIIARDASAEKIADEARAEAKKSGVASRVATMATHAAIGTAAGALGGAEVGHTKEGAVGGAIVGAISGARGEVRVPRMDVRAEKIIAKAAPKLAAAARRSPALARAIASATAAHGGGTGSISAQ